MADLEWWIVRSWEVGEEQVRHLLRRSLEFTAEEEEAVREIIAEVRRNGDAALLHYTSRFDGVQLQASELSVSEEELRRAEREVSPRFKEALTLARERILDFHRRQVRQSLLVPEGDGSFLGLLYLPLRRVGVYVPGGRAPYPSSVLMNVLPAVVAGVQEIVLVTPPRRDKSVDPHILVAARMAGVQKIYRVGGAQAVAALAYGTATIPRVDKIVGPGNVYVTLAKRLVFGQVGIDLLAGPSEVAVVADETADPTLVAADLLSQAEHDPEAASLLFTPSEQLARQVAKELEKQLEDLPRREVAVAALARHGFCLVVRSLAEALEWVNELAPEHLELMVSDPWRWLGRVQRAGAVFLGHSTPEPVGDYLAGSNHVLPTHGTARFSSGLGVEDFCRRLSVVQWTPERLQELGWAIEELAAVEGFQAHAQAVRLRLPKAANRLAPGEDRPAAGRGGRKSG